MLFRSSAEDVEADFDNLGLNGSPTKVSKSFTPEGRTGEGEIFKGDARDAVNNLIVGLKNKHLI